MAALRYGHSDVTVTRVTGAVNSNRAEERDHLRREHGLTKVDAWVAVTNATSEPECPKTGSAARMAKLRVRKRDAGLVTMDGTNGRTSRRRRFAIDPEQPVDPLES